MRIVPKPVKIRKIETPTMEIDLRMLHMILELDAAVAAREAQHETPTVELPAVLPFGYIEEPGC